METSVQENVETNETLDDLITALLVVGGLNWALVGLFKLDLVALLTGNRFGQKSALSTLIYELVGASALYKLLNLRETRPQLFKAI